jgi:hypothetical protein
MSFRQRRISFHVSSDDINLNTTDPSLISPNSKFRKIWDQVTFCLITYNVLTIPFRAAFMSEKYVLSTISQHWAYLMFDYLGDIFFWIDIYLHSRYFISFTHAQEKRSTLTIFTSRKISKAEIWKRYRKGTFW